MTDYTDSPAEPADQAAPDSKPTHPSARQSGRNHIVIATMHYGHKHLTFEKDVPVTVRDGTTLYVNVFRPPFDGHLPVIVSFDIWQGFHPCRIQHAGGGRYTLGQYNASLFAAWEAPGPGFWVPNGYVVVKAAARGTCGSVGRISPMSSLEAEDFYDVIEWCGASVEQRRSTRTRGPLSRFQSYRTRPSGPRVVAGIASRTGPGEVNEFPAMAEARASH
jgi:hypothetical protein